MHVLNCFFFVSAFTQAATLLSGGTTPPTTTNPVETQKVAAQASSTISLPAGFSSLPLEQQYELLKSAGSGEIVVNSSDERAQEVRELLFVIVDYNRRAGNIFQRSFARCGAGKYIVINQIRSSQLWTKRLIKATL